MTCPEKITDDIYASTAVQVSPKKLQSLVNSDALLTYELCELPTSCISLPTGAGQAPHDNFQAAHRSPRPSYMGRPYSQRTAVHLGEFYIRPELDG